MVSLVLSQSIKVITGKENCTELTFICYLANFDLFNYSHQSQISPGPSKSCVLYFHINKVFEKNNVVLHVKVGVPHKFTFVVIKGVVS